MISSPIDDAHVALLGLLFFAGFAGGLALGVWVAMETLDGAGPETIAVPVPAPSCFTESEAHP